MTTSEFIEIPGRWDIPYRHSAGAFASRFFVELRDNRRILAVRCPQCQRVLLPPRPFCERCFIRLDEWVPVKDTGTIESFTISYERYTGLPPPPYCIGFIKLGGADTALMHRIAGVDLSDPVKAPRLVKIGTRVVAVWARKRTGSILDILYFKPI